MTRGIIFIFSTLLTISYDRLHYKNVVAYLHMQTTRPIVSINIFDPGIELISFQFWISKFQNDQVSTGGANSSSLFTG